MKLTDFFKNAKPISNEEAKKRDRQARLRDFRIACEAARIHHEFMNVTLDDFDFTRNTQNRKQYVFIEKYIKELKSGEKGIFFTGDIGVGKTHLATVLFKAALWNFRQYGRWVLQADLLDSLRYMKTTGQYETLFRDCMNTNILLLDDFGYGDFNDYLREQMFRLINHRLGSFTILTTNCNGEELSRNLGDRIIDRVSEICIGLQLKGDSYRGSK
jgi:DNA replication protein DnaC